jgi:hypothetical protein
MSAVLHERGASLVAAIALLAVACLAPALLRSGSPAALIGVPVEPLIVVLVVALLPWRWARLAVALTFGVLVAVALVLAGLDAVFQSALSRPFDPVGDLPEIADGFGVVRDAVGPAGAASAVILLALTTTAAIAGVAWAVLRLDAALRRAPTGGGVAAAVVAGAWILAAVVGLQPVPGLPIAASDVIGSVAADATRVEASVADQAALQRDVADDSYRNVPAARLLTALRGKDVVIAFVESYGKVAVQGSSFSAGVDTVLRSGEAQLRADGYSSQSAFLASPTFGGVSWLAHSTLQTGLWIDSPTLYDRVVASDRFTLSDAFRRAGWRTVSDVPSDTTSWAVLDARDVGYRGPAFSYARIPDQYTWKHFADTVLAGPHTPVMAEIDLVSSHTPWTPLPSIVPWGAIGDGSVYDPQPALGLSPGVVWADPRHVQQLYGQSIQYSLESMLSFLHHNSDPNLVLVVLGDHQPARIVSGAQADHDVPISIIAKDPAVFRAISGWRWQPGLLPSPTSPVWRMDAFRDRFLAAFSH